MLRGNFQNALNRLARYERDKSKMCYKDTIEKLIAEKPGLSHLIQRATGTNLDSDKEAPDMDSDHQQMKLSVQQTF
ncbi:hypothetical protein AVEN_248010-1 [Araneus ventricosus]|uniref:Uncharacterized protein n=1 Tax=Araneus ventricosus TaxID=182803 RepID=A0A4Y2GAK3_ARAVE|nr:hypothetical protein AVEN_248010-1 [Araneus ventricosus]